MNIKSRLDKLEKKQPPKPFEINVWIYDEETGLHTRTRPDGTQETLTAPEWEKRTKGERVITVNPSAE